MSRRPRRRRNPNIYGRASERERGYMPPFNAKEKRLLRRGYVHSAAVSYNQRTGESVYNATNFLHPESRAMRDRDDENMRRARRRNPPSRAIRTRAGRVLHIDSHSRHSSSELLLARKRAKKAHKRLPRRAGTLTYQSAEYILHYGSPAARRRAAARRRKAAKRPAPVRRPTAAKKRSRPISVTRGGARTEYRPDAFQHIEDQFG